MTEPTCVSLIERLRQTTSDQPWENFHQIYGGMVMHWLMARGAAIHDAEDVRQDVMAAVLSMISDFEHNGNDGAFRSWLRQITVNRLHRFWEKKSRQQRQLTTTDFAEIAQELADPKSSLSIAWDRDYERYLVLAVLDQLHNRFSVSSLSAFRRLAIEHQPAVKVAAELQMTVGAVRVAHHRVLKTLKERIREMTGIIE